MMKFMKRFLFSVVVIVSLLLMIIIGSAVLVGVWVERSNWPAHFGNNQDNISYVTGKTDANDFTFLVVGDVKGGTATFEEMLDIIRGDKPAFAVIVGDLVGPATRISHKLFALEMQEHSRDIPMFAVVGNHDVDPDGSFGINDFEDLYGPAQFSFCVGEYLFVFLNDIRPYCESGEYIDFLESAIRSREGRIKKTFVFMHIPVIRIDGSLKNSGLAGSERFMELAKKYDVDYVFAGDHHGYIKQLKDNTTYIISGGGGGRLRGEHGKFHHLTRMFVKDGLVEETVIISKKYLETSELIERNLAVHIWPIISFNLFSRVVTTIILISAFLVFVYSFRRLRRPKKRRI